MSFNTIFTLKYTVEEPNYPINPNIMSISEIDLEKRKLNLDLNKQYKFINSKLKSIIEDITSYQLVYDVSNIVCPDR